MVEENNPAFIDHVPDINTVQVGDQLSTESGLFIKLPVLYSIVNKTQLNDKTDVDNHKEPTADDGGFLSLPIKVENDPLQDSSMVIPTDSGYDKVGRKICHHNMEVKITPNKSHECHICTKAFTSESILTYHLCKNTEEKPYGCSNYQKKFTTKSNSNKDMIK